jgi:sec-independent protein translocase protein TatA
MTGSHRTISPPRQAWAVNKKELISTMGLDNPIHIAFLLILLLLVFGAKRLPEMGRSLGSGMRGFKESLSGESVQPTLTAEQQLPAAMTANAQGLAPVPAPVPVAANTPEVPAA